MILGKSVQTYAEVYLGKNQGSKSTTIHGRTGPYLNHRVDPYFNSSWLLRKSISLTQIIVGNQGDQENQILSHEM